MNLLKLKQKKCHKNEFTLDVEVGFVRVGVAVIPVQRRKGMHSEGGDTFVSIHSKIDLVIIDSNEMLIN